MNAPTTTPEGEVIAVLRQCLALAYASKDFELHSRIHKLLRRIETPQRFAKGGFTGNGPIVAILDH